MAVPTGSGTEVLKAHSFDDVDLEQDLILGVQHHIYTVLSTICYCVSVGEANDVGKLQILGNGNHTGTSGTKMKIAQFNIEADQTFVFNDKFSFFGFEAVAYTEAATLTEANQAKIAAQGSSEPQKYQFDVTDADAHFDVHVSFIDQDIS